MSTVPSSTDLIAFPASRLSEFSHTLLSGSLRSRPHMAEFASKDMKAGTPGTGDGPQKLVSHAWSTATLQAGIEALGLQQVKTETGTEEDDEEIKAMEAQLEDS